MFYYYLAFAGGVVLSAVVLSIIDWFKTSNGYFRLDPIDLDEGTYKVIVSINTQDSLLEKDKIVLIRDFSQN